MKRVYEELICDHFAANRQMAFLSGPRQVGKTTLADMVLPTARYFNYDRPEDGRLINAGPDSVAHELNYDSPGSRCGNVIFDEIHKFPKWKRFLKGFFDVYGKDFHVAVTGSARLNVYKRGGDSLMGRYFPYRIHPVSMGEMSGLSMDILSLFRSEPTGERSELEDLLRFGGFPEPLLAGNVRFYNRWKNARRELVFHEDLRDLSRVQDIRGVRLLADLLAARVGGGVNYSGLAADLQVSPDTVKAWIELLASVYEVFEVRPWFKNVANSIRKQPKIYFWDWSSVAEGGGRGENLVASHLLKSVQWWTDSGLGSFELYYVRDKQQREVDFLVVRDAKPFLLVECKTSDNEPLSASLRHFQSALAVPYALQVAIDGERQNIDVFAYEGQSVKVSAIDLLSRLP